MLVNVIDKFSFLIGYNNLCAAIPTGEGTTISIRKSNYMYLHIILNRKKATSLASLLGIVSASGHFEK